MATEGSHKRQEIGNGRTGQLGGASLAVNSEINPSKFLCSTGIGMNSIMEIGMHSRTGISKEFDPINRTFLREQMAMYVFN